jgi:hypothetical protein
MTMTWQLGKAILLTALGLMLTLPVASMAADDLPDDLISKGGVIYPRPGTDMEGMFQTPSNVKEFLQPGMLLGVLPEDCISASHGKIGAYYSCHYDLALKPEELGGKTVYKVLDLD